MKILIPPSEGKVKIKTTSSILFDDTDFIYDEYVDHIQYHADNPETLEEYSADVPCKTSYTTCSSRFAPTRTYKCLINRFCNPGKSTIATKHQADNKYIIWLWLQ